MAADLPELLALAQLFGGKSLVPIYALDFLLHIILYGFDIGFLTWLFNNSG